MKNIKKRVRRDYTRELAGLITKEQWEEAIDNCIEGARDTMLEGDMVESVFYFLFNQSMSIFCDNLILGKGFEKSIHEAMEFLWSMNKIFVPQGEVN